MVLWQRSQIPLVCGDWASVRVWSMSLTDIQLELVLLNLAAVFGASIGQH